MHCVLALTFLALLCLFARLFFTCWVHAGQASNVDVDARDDQGYTPLLLAALHGHSDVVRVLLATERVDVNAQTADKLTPLHAALGEGHAQVSASALYDWLAATLMVLVRLFFQKKIIQIAEMLIDAGARAAALDEEGRSPFAVAKDPAALAAGVVAFQRRKERGEMSNDSVATTSSRAQLANAAAEDRKRLRRQQQLHSTDSPQRLVDSAYVTNKLDQLISRVDGDGSDCSSVGDDQRELADGTAGRHDTFGFQPPAEDESDSNDSDDADADERQSGTRRHVLRETNTPVASRRARLPPHSALKSDALGDISVTVSTVQPGAESHGMQAGEASEEVAESASEQPRGLSSVSRAMDPAVLAAHLTMSGESSDGDSSSIGLA